MFLYIRGLVSVDPTIKHGDPNNLEDYKGGRDFAALEKFAKGLKPVCSPAKMDLCEPEMKEKILELQKLSAADLDKQIKEKEAEIEKAEKFFTDEVDKLQKAYQKLQEDKEATVTAVKDSGLGLMKSVKAAAGKAELQAGVKFDGSATLGPHHEFRIPECAGIQRYFSISFVSAFLWNVMQ